MKVSEIKKHLARYDSNDELLIAWWDKEAYEYISGDETKITDEQWKRAIVQVDEIEDAFQDITYLIDQAIKRIKGSNENIV